MILLADFNWHSFFFCLFALISCAFAAGVLVSTNIVRMAFYLVLCLGSTAGLFFLAGAGATAAGAAGAAKPLAPCRAAM